MPAERHYVGINAAIFAETPEERERAVDAIAASIFVEWNVRNILVWENARSGVQHWRPECPAGRRAKTGRTRLIPREVGLTKPCGHCGEVDARERARDAERLRRRLVAIRPPENPGERIRRVLDDAGWPLPVIELALAPLVESEYDAQYRAAHLALPPPDA